MSRVCCSGDGYRKKVREWSQGILSWNSRGSPSLDGSVFQTLWTAGACNDLKILYSAMHCKGISSHHEVPQLVPSFAFFSIFLPHGQPASLSGACGSCWNMAPWTYSPALPALQPAAARPPHPPAARIAWVIRGYHQKWKSDKSEGPKRKYLKHFEATPLFGVDGKNW